MQGLLSTISLKAGMEQELSFPIVDWVSKQGESEYCQPGDEKVYQLKAHLGNQSYIEIVDSENEPQLISILEINKGVPALHLSPDSGDNLLHIHRAQGGFTLVPDNSEIRFTTPIPDRHTYNERHALLLKDD